MVFRYAGAAGAVAEMSMAAAACPRNILILALRCFVARVGRLIIIFSAVRLYDLRLRTSASGELACSAPLDKLAAAASSSQDI